MPLSMAVHARALPIRVGYGANERKTLLPHVWIEYLLRLLVGESQAFGF